MSRDFGRDVPDLEKLYARELWADFSYPSLGTTPGCAEDFTGFVPGTNSVKIWDKPGFSPYFTQWKPGKPGFVPGTNPGRKGGTESLCEKKFMCLSRSINYLLRMAESA